MASFSDARVGLTPQAARLAEHVEALVREHRVWLRGSNRRGRAWRSLRMMSIPEVRGQVSYMLALHELGHLLAPGHTTLTRLQQEAQAWQWALDNAICEPTPTTGRAMYRRLTSYLRNYVAVNLRNGREVRKIPLAGDPFYRVADLLADIGEVPVGERRHREPVE